MVLNVAPPPSAAFFPILAAEGGATLVDLQTLDHSSAHPQPDSPVEGVTKPNSRIVGIDRVDRRHQILRRLDDCDLAVVEDQTQWKLRFHRPIILRSCGARHSRAPSKPEGAPPCQ